MSLKKNDSSSVLFKKILIVDDETDLIQNLETMFKKEGWMVQTASDGNEALNVLREEAYPVILSDINMPHVDGLKFIEKINHENLDTKVIFMTGAPAYESLKKGIEEGLFRYIEKPFKIKEVLSLAHEAFEIQSDKIEKDSKIRAMKKEIQNHNKFFKKK